MPESSGPPLHIPAVPDAVTPAWLTGVLRDVDASLGEVTALRWEQIGQDQGLTGVVARFHLRYATPHRDAPSSLIAKFPLAHRAVDSAYRMAQQRDAATARRYYERCAREVRFYQEVARQGALPVPRLFYGAVDEGAGTVAIFLEDLGAGRVGDELRGCAPDEAAAVLAGLAPFHARWWADTKADHFPWLPRWGGDYRARQERYDSQVPRFLARYGRDLPASVRNIVERLRTRYGAVLAALDAAPATVIHADLHLDNVVFSPPGVASDAIVLDWQSVCRGPVVADVIPFVCRSLSVEERRRTGDEIVRRYHTLLVAHGVAGYSLDRLRADGRYALLRQSAGVVGWLAGVDEERLDGRERALVEAAIGDGRLVAALLDAGAADLLM